MHLLIALGNILCNDAEISRAAIVVRTEQAHSFDTACNVLPLTLKLALGQMKISSVS